MVVESEGFQEYRRLILQALERLDGEVRNLNGKIDAFRAQDIADLKVEVAMLKVKAGMWGAVCGLIAGALSVVAATWK